MPEAQEAEPTTDVNNAPSTLDEDGVAEDDAAEDAKSEESEILADDAAPAVETDNTPAINALTVITRHTHGAELPHVDITAKVHTSTGWATKRKVLTGAMTAKQIATAILDIANW